MNLGLAAKVLNRQVGAGGQSFEQASLSQKQCQNWCQSRPH